MAEKKKTRRTLGRSTSEIEKRLAGVSSPIEAMEELAGLVSEQPRLREEAQKVVGALLGGERRWAGTNTGDLINTYVYGDERDKAQVQKVVGEKLASGEMDKREYDAFNRARVASDRLSGRGRVELDTELLGNLGFGAFTAARRGLGAGLGDFGFGTALSSDAGEAALGALPAVALPLRKGGPRLTGTQTAMSGAAAGGIMLDRNLGAERSPIARPTVEEIEGQNTSQAGPRLTPEGIKNLHARALKALGMDFNAVPEGRFTYSPRGVNFRYTKFFLDPQEGMAYTGKRGLAEKDFEHDQFARWMGYSARRGGPGEPRALFPIDNALSDGMIRAGSHNSRTSPLLQSFNFRNTPENKQFLRRFLRDNVLPGEITLDPWEPAVGRNSFSHSVPGYQGDLERALQWLGK